MLTPTSSKRGDEGELKWVVCLCILQGGILALDQDDGHDFHRDWGQSKLDRSRGVSFGDDDWRIERASKELFGQ
jgi:hypothetical protein